MTAFQRSAGLVPDGIAGALTQKGLGSADLTERRAEPEQPAWLALAAPEIGTHEGVGKANKPIVVQYFADAGSRGSRTTPPRGARASSAPCLTGRPQALGEPRDAVL